MISLHLPIERELVLSEHGLDGSVDRSARRARRHREHGPSRDTPHFFARERETGVVGERLCDECVPGLQLLYQIDQRIRLMMDQEGVS